MFKLVAHKPSVHRDPVRDHQWGVRATITRIKYETTVISVKDYTKLMHFLTNSADVHVQWRKMQGMKYITPLRPASRWL
jgi:hypothetical protein